jgi:hypothetical protein
MIADVAFVHPDRVVCLFVMLVLHVHAGRIPSAALDDWVEHVNASLNDGELSLQKDVCERSMKLYGQSISPLRSVALKHLYSSDIAKRGPKHLSKASDAAKN